MLGKVGAFEFLCQRFFNSNKTAIVDEKMSITKFRSAVESHHGVGICVSTRAHHGARDPQFTYVTPNVAPLDCFIMCCVHLTEQPPVHSFREENKGEWGRDASPHAPLRHLFIVAAATTNTTGVVLLMVPTLHQKKYNAWLAEGVGGVVVVQRKHETATLREKRSFKQKSATPTTPERLRYTMETV